MYKLNQEQEILRETIRDFARNVITPLAPRIDSDGKIPEEIFSKLAGMGLFGITLPTNLGGAGADFISFLVAIEELSKASGSLGVILSVHNSVCEALMASKNSELKEKLLSKLVCGDVGAFCMSTEESKLECSFSGDEILIDGTDRFVLGASLADVFVVYPKLNDSNNYAMVAFAKEALSAGKLSIEKPPKLLGMRATGAASVRFDRATLPINCLLFDISKSEESFVQVMTKQRFGMAAIANGIAGACIESSLAYANERAQFNTKIGKFYAVQDMIATDIIALETARALCYTAASESKVSDKTSESDSAIAKISASNSALSAARHSIRIYGGYGFTRDYPVERYARDARFTQLFLEKNEDLKSLIARNALGLD